MFMYKVRQNKVAPKVFRCFFQHPVYVSECTMTLIDCTVMLLSAVCRPYLRQLKFEWTVKACDLQPSKYCCWSKNIFSLCARLPQLLSLNILMG